MKRVIAAIVMGIAVLLAVWWLPTVGLYAFILAAAAVGLMEYSRMFLADSVERWSGWLAGLLTAATMLFCPLGGDAVVLLQGGLLFALSMIFMWRAKEMPGVATRLSLAMMGIVYLGVAFPFWGWIAGMPNGRTLVLLALVPACLCDTLALATGKAFGKRKFAPIVSPKKTVEGFIGALAGSIIGIFLVRNLIAVYIPFRHTVALAFIIWITSPLGDLIESMFKRSCGVKDSGTIIPGHGGVLDRLDALIFTGPAVYAYLKYVIGI